MAFYRKLTEGWKLTDGILPETFMEKPVGVYEALREAGRVPDAEMGLNAMECEWIGLREWTYSLLLDAPGEDDERVLIELPKCAGTGKAYLNGEMIGLLYSGAVRLDMTGSMQEGENLLELKFAPRFHVRPDRTGPLPEIGLMCAPVLRTVNFALIERMSVASRMDGRDGIISVEMEVNAFAGGKYLFAYGVMLDGDPVGRFEFAEKLKAAKQKVRHEIRIENAMYLETERLEETVYSIKLTMERGGVGCDVRHTETALRKCGPTKCAEITQWPVSADMIDRLLEMGADGIMISGQPEDAFEKNDFLAGLTVVHEGERIAEAGVLSAEELKRYAGGEKTWPMDCAAWKLRGGALIEKGETFGADAEKYAKAARFVQAQRVMQKALANRREGKRSLIRMDEEFAYFASDALIEKSGSERPAAALARRAWNENLAFAELPEDGKAACDRLLQMNVWALAENLRGRILTVKASVFTAKGEKLAEQSFPVMGGEARLAGVIEARTPVNEEILIVRTELSEVKGEVLSRMDSILAAGDAPAIGLILAAEETKLTSRFSKVKNDGEAAALSAGNCLLPGEDADKAEIEWVNA